MEQFSYTYKRGPKLSEAEIYQAGVAAAELAAAKKAVVNFYIDQNTGEVLTICQDCFTKYGFTDLSYVNKAGDWDICCGDGCEAQNIPAHYHG